MSTNADQAALLRLPDLLVGAGYVDAFAAPDGSAGGAVVEVFARGGTAPPCELGRVLGADVVGSLLRLGILLRNSDDDDDDGSVHLGGLALIPAAGRLVFVPCRSALTLAEAARLIDVSPVRGARSLDLFCGAGTRTVALAEQGPVVAIDRDPVLLACADLNLRLHGLEDRVELVQADLAGGPTWQGTFDHVSASPPLAPAGDDPLRWLRALLDWLPATLAAEGVAHARGLVRGARDGPPVRELFDHADRLGLLAVLSLPFLVPAQADRLFGFSLVVSRKRARRPRSSSFTRQFASVGADYDPRRRDQARAIVNVIAGRLGLADLAAVPQIGDAFVFVGVDQVVKLYPPRLRIHHLAEEAARGHARAALGDLVPAALETGAIEGWSYTLMQRAPGEILGVVWPRLDRAARSRLTVDIGAALRALHGRPVDDELIQGDWPRFVEWRRAMCVPRQRQLGVDGSWLRALPAYLADIAPPPRIALVHGDVGPGNLLVRAVDGRFGLSGIIDFGQARLGDPLYDLVAPGVAILGRERDLLPDLLQGYGPVSASALLRLAFLHEWAKVGDVLPPHTGDWPAVERAVWPGADP